MDRLLVAAGFILPLTVALAWAIWFLVAQSRKQRRRIPTTHAFRGQGEAVTVAELLEEAREQGEAIRLNWSETDRAEIGWMRPYVQDQFPTAILPKVEDSGEYGQE